MFRCAVVLCLIMLCAAHAFAENPFGRALVLNGGGQYFEVPDSACADIASLYTFTLEIRYKLDGHQGFNLFNKWRYYKPTTSKRHPRSRFRGHGWMIEVNRSSSDIMGKLELSYLNPLDAFLANDYVRITRAHADP